MAQSGLHGIIGTAFVNATSRNASEPGRAVAAKSWAYGFISGSVLPDVDLAALAVTYLFNSKLAMRMHRTATHSLVMIALFTAITIILSTTRGGKAFFKGVGTGMAVHAAVDILVWFSAVDILWPLGHFGLPSEINLWKWVSLPRLWGNFLGSTDFLMMGLFYLYLLRLGRKYETNPSFLPKLRGMMAFNFVAFSLYIGASFFLTRSIFDVAQYAVVVLVQLPMTVIAIRGSKPSIERIAINSGYR